MTPWMLALVALVPAFAVPAVAATRGGTADRLVAVQLATSVATLMLALMTFTFDQSASIDLALTLTFLTLPGTLIIAAFIERWL